MLDRLKPKYDPYHNPEADNLSLTPERVERNKDARENGDYITFDPSLVKGDNLAANFRVFGKPQGAAQTPAFRRRPNQVIPDEEEHTAHTSGASAHAGQEHASAGGGIWFGEGDMRNAAIRVSGGHRSKSSGEMAAILHAVRAVSYFAPLKIVSTS